MIDKNKGFGSTNLEQSTQNVDENIVDNNTNIISNQEPVNNVSWSVVNNDANQSLPTNNMNQSYVAPSFETPATPVTE